MRKFTRRAATMALSAAMIATAGAGLAGSANASITDTPGWYHFTSFTPGTCVKAQSAPPGAPLVMWRCLNTTYEEWQTKFVDLPSDQWANCGCTQTRMFVNQITNLCMAVATDADVSPVAVLQQTCNAADPKQWWTGAGSEYTTVSTFTTHKHLRAPGDKFDNGVSLEAAAYDTQEMWVLPTWS